MCIVNGGLETAAFLLTLVLHEFAHILLAQAFGMEVEEMQLLPFGCAAKTPGISFCNSRAEILVAAAGPGINLLMAAILIVIPIEEKSVFLEAFCKYHIGMAAVNLLPVLPMDGGRILCAALSLKLGERRATQLTSIFGLLTAFLGLAASVWLIWQGQWNLSLLIVAIFMLGASWNYYRSALQSNAEKMLARRRQIGKSGVAQVHAIALNREKPLGRALTQLDQRAYNLVYILDDQLHPVGVMDEQLLSELAVRHGVSAKFSEIPWKEEKERRRLND